jgi:hypothetical protein
MKLQTQPKNQNDRSKPMSGRRDLTEREVAQYTADIMLELRQLSKNAGLITLQSLIELVYYEAFATSNPVIVPDGELKRLKELEAEGQRLANGTGRG